MSKYVEKKGLAFFYSALLQKIANQSAPVTDITEALTIPKMTISGATFYYVKIATTTIPKTGASVSVLPSDISAAEVFIANYCNVLDNDDVINTFVLYDASKIMIGSSTTTSAGVTTDGAWATVSGGAGGDIIELNLAEYNALSSAEQNNGTMYLITDAESSTMLYAPIAGMEISKADYDELTTEEQNNGILYLITDGDPSAQLYAPVAGREVTQDEYDSLTETQKNDGTMYLITDNEPGEDNYAPIAGIEISKEDYDELTTEEQNNGTLYLVIESGDDYLTMPQIASSMTMKGEIVSTNLPAAGSEGDFYYLTDELEGRYYTNGEWKNVI